MNFLLGLSKANRRWLADKLYESVDAEETCSHVNDTTLKAFQDADEGKTIKCVDFEDYLRKVQ